MAVVSKTTPYVFGCFLFWILTSDLVSGQWPVDCVTKEATVSRTCCPTAINGQECGGTDRGFCDNIIPSSMGVSFLTYDYYWLDERVSWPGKFYDFGCSCQWPFQGAACDECVWGYYGEECEEFKLLTRVDVTKEENMEIGKKMIDYIVWSKGNTSSTALRNLSYDVMLGLSEDGDFSMFYELGSYFDVFGWLHEYATSPMATEGDCSYAHKGPALFPFHRHMMLQFERMLQHVGRDDDFALPYWDWIGEGTDCVVCTDELFGNNLFDGTLISGAFTGPEWINMCEEMTYFINGSVCGETSGPITRAPGTNFISAPSLPPEQDLVDSLNWIIYEDIDYMPRAMAFRPAVEGTCNAHTGVADGYKYMHAMAHEFFGNGSTMANSPASDPIFYVFHSYFDLAYEQWLVDWGIEVLKTYPNSRNPIGHAKESYIVPFYPIIKNELYLNNSVTFGYTYDIFN